MHDIRYGQIIYDTASKIFPIYRCLTGDGVRETISMLDEYVSGSGVHIEQNEIPSGTQVFDWTVPKEWRCSEAYIEEADGIKIVDIKKNNLHVMGYSMPVDKWVSREELMQYIYTQEDQPDVIPYVTSYYKERFGFCMSENQKRNLIPGEYHMYIDSELFDGSLTYGEAFIPGQSDKEIFFSTYVCHPSMANDNCSGPALQAELIKYVAGYTNRKYSYRFVFAPETIGAITYLSKNIEHLKKHMIAGFNLSCVGDDRDYSMVESIYGGTLADRVLENVLRSKGRYKKYSYVDRNSDERQYNAPGVQLPFVDFSRSLYGYYPEYHTSADDMNLVSPEGFQGSYEVMTQVIDTLEYNDRYRVKIVCEPQLGKRGLYPTVSQKGIYDSVRAMLDFLAYADGRNDLIGISDIIHQPISVLIPVIEKLKKEKMFMEIEN